MCLLIKWILKILFQFCYSRLHWRIETVSCLLLLRTARMDVDWNFKKLGQLLPRLQKPPKIWWWMWNQMEFVWYILQNSAEAFRSKGTKWLLLHRIDLEQQYPHDIANPFKYLHSKARAFTKCTCCECPKTALFPGQIPHGNGVLIERYS